jgi:hypothetical protein
MDSHRVMRALAWAGPACILGVLLGWMVMAGFLPPPDPARSAEEVKAFWQDGTGMKTAGMLVAFWGGVLFLPFATAISLALARDSRALAFTQFGLGAFGIAFFAANFLLLATLGFDPDRSADSIKLVNDVGFIFTFASVAPFTFQDFVICAAILKSKDSVFPRWVAYLNLWVGILFIPATVVPFFDHGPFAWNGLFAFWIPVGVFVPWFFVMCWAIRRVPAPVAADSRAIPAVDPA